MARSFGGVICSLHFASRASSQTQARHVANAAKWEGAEDARAAEIRVSRGV